MVSQEKINKYYYTPAIGWGILICYFSIMPGNEVPLMLKSVADYVLHFLIYAMLGILSLLGANGFSKIKISTRLLWQIVLICSVLGLSIEIIQETFIDGRHFQLSDLTFNTLGVFLILPLNRFVLK